MTEKPEISVEYEVMLAVKIDEETKRVTSVQVYPQDFNTVRPFQVYVGDASEEYVSRVATDHLTEEHEEFERWEYVASNVHVLPRERYTIPFEMREPAE